MMRAGTGPAAEISNDLFWRSPDSLIILLVYYRGVARLDQSATPRHRSWPAAPRQTMLFIGRARARRGAVLLLKLKEQFCLSQVTLVDCQGRKSVYT